MATEDEIFEEILKTEVSVDSVLKRIDREEKELQSLKNEKDNAETKEKILAIEESIDEDKKWISMQKKSQPEVVIPPPPPPKIDDIVANDTEIIRIISEISTFLDNNANNHYITEYIQAINRASAQPTLANNKFLHQNKVTATLSTHWDLFAFIDPVKWYVRDIIKPKGLSISRNLKTAIESMESSLKWFNLVDRITVSRTAKRPIQKTWTPLFSNAEILSSDEDDMMPYVDLSRRKQIYSSVPVYGVPFFQDIYNVLLKPRYGSIDTKIAIQYVSLVLQLHRRIQAIMVENGFQQGGKRKRTIKKGRKTRKTKMYKKIRTNRKK